MKPRHEKPNPRPPEMPAGTSPIAPGPFAINYEGWIRHRVADLLSIAERALANIEKELGKPKSEVKNILGAERILIEAGRDEIGGSAQQLFIALGLAGMDDRRREDILRSVFHLINGARELARYDIAPAVLTIAFENARAREAREGRKRKSKTTKRDEIIREVKDASEEAAPKKLLEPVNTELRRSRLRQISLPTLYRVLQKLEQEAH